MGDTSTPCGHHRRTCYRLPIDALTAALRRDAELEFQFLCKVTHALRESQRRGIILGRRSASGRFVMFLRMLERTGVNQPERTIAIPMSRSDIASYVGLSLEAVSRATGKLVREGIVSFRARTPCAFSTAPVTSVWPPIFDPKQNGAGGSGGAKAPPYRYQAIDQNRRIRPTEPRVKSTLPGRSTRSRSMPAILTRRMCGNT